MTSQLTTTLFATAEWSNHTWLVRGSISQAKDRDTSRGRRVPVVVAGRHRIVFKQHGNLPVGTWRLVEYAIASGKCQLAETRSVDDQVEWLDTRPSCTASAHRVAGGGR